MTCKGILAGIAIATTGIGTTVHYSKGRAVLRPIEELKVRITASTEIPDPAKVQTTGDWYYLDHVSSGLASFDADQRRFFPLYAEKWSTRSDGTHVFRLREGAKFHDGTAITIKDVLWTIKRQTILKTSTHFPLWEYVVGCENIKSLDEECEGLKIISPSEIGIKLKVQTDSFFLQLASPETGIWWAGDMNPRTLELRPTKFSGPYFVDSTNGDFAVLKRNEFSPITRKFPNSPRLIRLIRIPMAGLDDAMMRGDVDLVVRSYRPMGEPNWQEANVEVKASTPSTVIYLHGLGTGERPAIGKDLVEGLWKARTDKTLSDAGTFLPFKGPYDLSRDQFLAALPAKTAGHIKILCPEGFFSEAFLSQIRDVGAPVGAKIEFFFAPAKEWLATFDDPTASSRFDYILSVYAASERYPAVQLRYITGGLAKPPIDLKKAESPDLNPERIQVLKSYQQWLLKSRQAIPLYFGPTLLLSKKNLDLGVQSSSDSEIELWRVQERVRE